MCVWRMDGWMWLENRGGWIDVVLAMEGWMWFGEWMGGCGSENGWVDVVWRMDGDMVWRMGCDLGRMDGCGLENGWVDG